MGANSSSAAVTRVDLENALAEQRRFYEVKTKSLLSAEKDKLARTLPIQSTSQSPPPYEIATNQPLYPNLEAMQIRDPIPTPKISPSAPPHVTFSTENPQLRAPESQNTSDISDARRSSTPQRKSQSKFKNNNYQVKPCPNKKDGCRLHFRSDLLKKHLQECAFKDLVCPINDTEGNCSWIGKRNHIISHFEECHPDNRKLQVNTESFFELTTEQNQFQLVNICNNLFLFHACLVPLSNQLYVVVRYIGTEVSAAKWSFILRIYNKKEPRRLFENFVPCFSSIHSLHSLCLEEKISRISMDYAASFAHNERISYKIFLTKCVDVTDGQTKKLSKPTAE